MKMAEFVKENEWRLEDCRHRFARTLKAHAKCCVEDAERVGCGHRLCDDSTNDLQLYVA